MHVTRRRIVSGLAASLALPRMVWAQPAWRPSQPIKIIVPFPAGGTNDLMARPLAEALRARFDQSVVVENRSGAGGTIGATLVHRAAPDGHTLLVTSAILVTAGIVQTVPWSAVNGFSAIAQIARSPNAIAVHAGLPIRTVPELIDYARREPGKVSYGSVGVGSLGHFMTEALSLRAGIRMTHVPYRGGAQAVTDLASGQLQLLVSSPPPIIPMARDGKVRIIGYTASGEPAPGLEAPTLMQSGIDMEAGLWFGFFGPPGLPAPILQTLNEVANSAVRSAEFGRMLRAEGAIPTPMTPADFAKVVRSEDTRWREVAQQANIRL
jgi:tripartite-type tricarboxylate transporter receptor subunit TctC